MHIINKYIKIICVDLKCLTINKIRKLNTIKYYHSIKNKPIFRLKPIKIINIPTNPLLINKLLIIHQLHILSIMENSHKNKPNKDKSTQKANIQK